MAIRSDEAELVGLRLVEEPGTGRAPQARLDRSAAQGMTHRFRVGRATRTPVGQQAEDAGELEALIGQGVGEPGRAFRVRRGAQEPLALELELVYHNVDGRILISGKPGFPRSWIANLRANPRFTFHLKHGVRADLPATARVITDRAERERLLTPIAEGWRINLTVMVASSPLVEVTFD